MISVVNYIIESNVALLLLLTIYKVALARETDFKMIRFVLLAGLLISLIFPLIRLEILSGFKVPGLSKLIPVYWLPEVVITDSGQFGLFAERGYDLWSIISGLYGAGVAFFAILFIIQIFRIMRLFKSTST